MPHTATTLRTEAALSSFLAAAVARLSRRLRQERGTELAANQLAALGTLRRQGPLTLGALAAKERVQPPSMTRTVNCLSDLGLLRREAHPTDGRQVMLHLSETGERILAAERRRRDAWLSQRLRELKPSERDVLRAAAVILQRLADA
ncbi:MAG: MarR family winged helix-turn-helix transcriptional regulator [Nocardioidaceae bacterium]